MGVDASVTHTTFFIASILVAASISGVIIGVSNSMANEIKVKSQVLGDEMATAISIVNDPRNMPYEAGVLTVYVKNVGEISLNYNNIVILIDGVYMDHTASVAGGSTTVWGKSAVIEATVAIALGPGDHYVKVVTENGVSDMLYFRM